MSKDKAVANLIETAIDAVKPPAANLHITLRWGAQEYAKAAMADRGLPVREHFDGPIFKDIVGYQVNQEWVAVSLRDGSTYVYPADHVARLKHYYNNKE